MPTYRVILGDKIWKRGGKRKHRTFTVEASSESEAKKIALAELKLQTNVTWKPAYAEARKIS